MRKPICPGEPALSAMMRLAQLLSFLPGGSAEEAQKCLAAMERERIDVDRQGNLELTVLSKILLYPRSGKLFPKWFDLLVRADNLMIENDLLSRANEFSAPGEADPPHPCGIFFACQMRNIETVADFHQIVSRLDKEPNERRVRFLSSYRPGRGDISILVNHGWMREGRSLDFDWEAAAKLYAETADIAFNWQNKMLASRCAIAQAICYDENGQDPGRAFKSLEDAERRFGFDIALVRAKAKVLWRRKDHVAALPLLAAAAEQGEHDQIEHAYIAREAGISAAELGKWVEAEMWFQRAHIAASGIDLPVVKSMSVGLIADTAHAAFMAGRPKVALEKLLSALQQVQDLDPEGPVSEAYCHRVVRHAVLWLLDQVTGRMRVYQDTFYVPGCASNPEPPEEIRLHPLGDIDLAFYLLADVDEALDEPTGLHRDFRKHLVRGPALNFEIARNLREDDRAIREHNISNLVWRIRRHATLIDYLSSHPEGEAYEDIQNPIRGEVKPADIVSAPPHLTTIAEDYLITFIFVLVFAGKLDAVETAIDTAIRAPEIADLHPILARMNAAVPTIATSDREGAASTIGLLRTVQYPNPLEFWWAGAWMLIHLRSSKLRPSLAESVIGWIFDGWKRRVVEQRFLLSAPSLHVPPIEACLTRNDRTLSGATRLVLAAAPAAAAQINPVIDALRDLL